MTRWFGWVAGVLAAVVLGTGVYGTFRYRPDATGVGLGLQRLHAIAGIALAVVVVIGLAAFVWERRPDRRHGLPAFVVVGVVGVVLAVEVVIGRRIAWDQLALWAFTDGDLERYRGVVLRGLPLKFVVTDARVIDPADFRRMAWLHGLVLPALVGLGAGFVLWWTRRFANRAGDRSGSGRVG